MRHKITVYERLLLPASFGQTEPEMQQTVICSPFASVVTLRGSRRWGSVNIDKRATHLFECPYTAILAGLDSDNNFIEFQGERHRILEVENENGDNWTVVIQTTNRGDEAEEATAA